MATLNNAILELHDGATAEGTRFGLEQSSTALIDGAGSKLTAEVLGVVGQGASLIITNGASVDLTCVCSSQALTVGEAAGTSGSVTISGPGSVLSIPNSYAIFGEKGDGKLIVQNGGQINTPVLDLGQAVTGSGFMTIAGQGSSATISHEVWVGLKGHAQLDLYDGGALNSDTLSIAPNLGSSGIVNIGGGENDPAKVAGILNVDHIIFSQNGGGVGTLNFNTIDVTADGTTVRAAISGKGTINQIAGTTILTGDNSDFSGVTNVTGGTLVQGAAGSFSSASSYSLSQAGTLDFGGFSTSIASLINDGSVDFGGTGGTTLHVIGNYSGNGAVTINSVLGGDDSKTDLLQVDGDTSGATKLNVINRDGAGASTVNGIKVVDVGGNSEGSFALGNGYTTKDGLQAVVG
ncbi:autotransporter outer membrane beta-barrel domain-containing protein, partial [Brucella pseudogrignonensis]